MARDITGVPAGGSGPRSVPAAGRLPAAGWPAGVLPTPESFAAELRRVRLQAGAPSYRLLERQAGYSRTTLWRAFAGERLPRWDLVVRILRALGVDRLQIDGGWREMWCQAREEERRGGEPDAQHAATAGPTHGTPGEGRRRLSALTSFLAGGQSLPASQECEDCGALIGDLVRHQAWHWRVERQLSRAILRSVEGTGQ